MTRDKRRKRRNEGEVTPSPRSYQKKPPFWKAIIIQILRGTSGILETVAVKLETETPSTPENTREGVFRGWDRFLNQVRLFLPSSVSNALSDTVLTGILAVFVVGIVWYGTTFFSGKFTELSKTPPTEEIPQPTPTVTASPKSSKLEVIPSPTVEATPSPTVEATPEVEEIIPSPSPSVTDVTPVPELEVTPSLEPTVTPTQEATAEPTPTPTPTPVIELTPEQALIAAIQNQVAEISDRFSTNLIKSVQANFRTSDLTIQINDTWYTLEKSQQDKFAQAILQRSRQLDFLHLEILDAKNKLIARSPIVGNEMIIYKRETNEKLKIKN
jgi:hypothetical protein